MTLKEAGEALVSFGLYGHFKMGNCVQGQCFFFAFRITFCRTASRDLSRCRGWKEQSTDVVHEAHRDFWWRAPARLCTR